MADIFGIGTTIGAIGDTIIEGLNYAQNKEAFEFNKKQQEYANKWNEYVYEDQKKREDTAVQRRAEDLEKAGMNKLMAAGGSAGAGGAVTASGSSLQGNNTQLNLTEKAGAIYDTVYKMLTMNNDLATSQAQRDLIRAQTIDTLENSKNHIVDRENKRANTKYTKELEKNAIQEREKLLYDLEKSMKMNLRTSDATDTRANTLSGAVNEGASIIGDWARKIMGRNTRYKRFR